MLLCSTTLRQSQQCQLIKMGERGLETLERDLLLRPRGFSLMYIGRFTNYINSSRLEGKLDISYVMSGRCQPELYIVGVYELTVGNMPSNIISKIQRVFLSGRYCKRVPLYLMNLRLCYT